MSPITMENNHLQIGKSYISMGHLATKLCCFQGLHLDHGPRRVHRWSISCPLKKKNAMVSPDPPSIKANGLLSTKSSWNSTGISPVYPHDIHVLCFIFWPYHRITVSPLIIIIIISSVSLGRRHNILWQWFTGRWICEAKCTLYHYNPVKALLHPSWNHCLTLKIKVPLNILLTPRKQAIQPHDVNLQP